MKAPRGIFCGNYVFTRNPWPPCHQVWCGRCYKVASNLKFHITQPQNDQGVVFKRKVDEKRFVVGRDGDSLLQQFQCDLCWFRNIQKRSPK